MKAKEYLKNRDIPNEVITIQRDGFIEGNRVSFLMEEYHQAKSKEEAEERYRAAIKLFAEEYLEEGLNIKDFPQTIKAMYLAAFGKEKK